MNSLSNIFPVGYPNIPTAEDLRIEVQDMLRYCQYPADMLIDIAQANECPYYQEALLFTYEQLWLDMLRHRKSFAGYQSGYGWICYWPNYENDFRDAYIRFHDLQITQTNPNIAPVIELPIELVAQNHEGIVEHVKSGAKKALQSVVTCIKEHANTAAQTIDIKQITINMPIYIIQGNVGNCIGQTDNINIK